MGFVNCSPKVGIRDRNFRFLGIEDVVLDPSQNEANEESQEQIPIFRSVFFKLLGAIFLEVFRLWLVSTYSFVAVLAFT